jgi:cobalt/nickel transport system ATP-binding protein
MLDISGLSVQYEGTGAYAVHNITLNIKSGERIALMGPNGAGKSTLLLALTGVLPRVSGSINADGVLIGRFDIAGIPPAQTVLPPEKKSWPLLRQKVGLLFQNPDDQLFMPTVYDDITFGPRNQGISETETEVRAHRVMESLGILHLKKRMPHQLSGGEKRLAALAGLLVMEPKVLLMDEPTAFLDPRASRRLAEILKELPQALLIATHDAVFTRAVCGRAVLMKDGALFADGAAAEILDDTTLLLECGL